MAQVGAFFLSLYLVEIKILLRKLISKNPPVEEDLVTNLFCFVCLTKFET